MRRRSASSRPAAARRRTGRSARRRCCRGLHDANHGSAAERAGHRRVPAGDVGVPRARADAARRLSRSGRHVQPCGGRASISAAFVDAVPCATIDEVFRAIESGQTDYAVVPVENSTEGAVGRTLDLMCTTELSICGEVKLRIQQNLLSNAGALDAVTQGLFACAVARAMRAVAREASAGRAARRGGEQCRGRAARRRRGERRGDRRRERGGDLRPCDPRAAHRGRAEQHDALLGARTPAGRRRPDTTRRRS